jgi:glyoxylase-like metal-dependent hydrolase (beta-lactamase superfamily II)
MHASKRSLSLSLSLSRATGTQFLCALAITGALAATSATAQPAAPEPMIRTDATEPISEHVYVILDQNVSFVPNVGIVVGDRATLIVDTGLGTANGRIVLAEARKLSDNDIFYLTATHFHPEHDLGALAFPDSARMVRWAGQQAEADSDGAATIQRFSGISPAVAGLLDGVDFRAPDVLFEDKVTIDLGGVRVVASGVGPNHTLGDTVFWVEGDRVLFTGDVVMPIFPSVGGQTADLDKWLRNLDNFEQLNPAVVVPAHGRLGDVELIRNYRSFLGAARERVLERKRRGESLETITAALSPILAEDFAVLAPANGSPAGRINGAIQAAWRVE